MNVETMPTYDELISDTQYFVLWGVAAVGCALTWFGTISIIYIARRKLNSIYHRLLFVISCVELLSNFIGFFAPILMDKDTGYPLARGNRATCSTLGVVLLFSVISKAFSSCYISMYFMLTVRYNWNDEKIRAYEWFAYLLAFCIPLSYAVVGLMNDFFNPNAIRLCAISSYPAGCRGDECIRGSRAPILSTIRTATAVVICLIAITCTILLFLSVRHQANQSTRHSFAGSVNENAVKRIKLVRTQTVLYVVVFFNNFVWLLLFNVFVYVGMDRAIFASSVILYIFGPSYGFFIYCIYCYPRYGRIKKYFPEKSCFGRMKLLYTKDEGEEEIIARRRARRSQIFADEMEMAGANSQLTSSSELKANESRYIVVDETTASNCLFHGSEETSIKVKRRPTEDDNDRAIDNRNDTVTTNEFLESMEDDKSLYVKY